MFVCYMYSFSDDGVQIKRWLNLLYFLSLKSGRTKFHSVYGSMRERESHAIYMFCQIAMVGSILDCMPGGTNAISKVCVRFAEETSEAGILFYGTEHVTWPHAICARNAKFPFAMTQTEHDFLIFFDSPRKKDKNTPKEVWNYLVTKCVLEN